MGLCRNPIPAAEARQLVVVELVLEESVLDELVLVIVADDVVPVVDIKNYVDPKSRKHSRLKSLEKPKGHYSTYS